jgi:PadR family transcriptional regulator, regulatory protein PadR
MRTALTDPTQQLIRGTLHLLILRQLAAGPAHGFSLLSAIADRSDGVLTFEDGALYQALHRMQERNWVASEWGHADNGKRARFYQLTREGRRRLAIETDSWQRYARAVSRMLEPEPA